jgi:hypothetical protein
LKQTNDISEFLKKTHNQAIEGFGSMLKQSNLEEGATDKISPFGFIVRKYGS